ncbi:MAG: ABC transporter permease [Pirellulales bacterium]|nr:ABC transporter permease [Pirellulales bacterium]
MDDRVIRKTKTKTVATPAPPQHRFRSALRREIPRWKAVFFGALCIAICGGIWWYLTRGEIVEERMINKYALPSPAETFADLRGLWIDGELTRNAIASLIRVTLGFALAAVLGIPLGILCGSYPWVKSFLAPVTIFGRNIPIAALIPLTYSFFGTGEYQKMMFIFIACVAFIIDDTATAIGDVSSRYIDTAYTLGANQWQIISKVIFPLALPNIFNSLRLLFGLAFGYIMLVESVTDAKTSGGLGFIILTSQRLSFPGWIILILLIIPILALAIDRALFWIQKELFPYQYGGSGVLRRGVGICLHCVEDIKFLFCKPVDYNTVNPPQLAAAPVPENTRSKPS